MTTASIPVHHAGDLLSSRRRSLYVVVLGMLTALGPFTIDTYLPAFPTLGRELNAADAAVQLTLTATTLGFAIGQLLVGPWSDRIGRRRPLIAANALHIAASVGAALSPSIAVLGGFRFLQGFGAAAGAVVVVAVVRDLFGGVPLVKMLSSMALVSGLAPVIAPLVGSQLLAVMSWRGLFVFLAIYGAVMITASVLLVPETLPAWRRRTAETKAAGGGYRALFRDRIYVGIVIIAAANFSGLFAYLSSSSFLFEDVFGFSAQQYGLLFGINSIAVIIGVQTAGRLARRVGPQWILVVSTSVQLLAATALVLDGLAGFGLLGTLIPLWFFILGCGAAFPLTQVLALMNHGREAGTAASVLGAANFGVSGLLSPLVGVLQITSAVPMGAVMIGTTSVAIITLWAVVRPTRVPALAR